MARLPPAAEDEVLAQVQNGVGTLILNRPKALNALSYTMVNKMNEVLLNWSQPGSGVACVIVKGAGGKAFCAGGDVKATVLACREDVRDWPGDFFTHEYNMDLMINRLPVPYVALIDGIVMGGGAGCSINGHFRVATERTVFAMPECAIGLFPDVGAAFFLNQLPGHLGMYCALTGARLSGVTVHEAGLATHYLPSSAIPELEARLHALGPKQARHLDAVARVLDDLQAEHGPLPHGDLPRILPLINVHFSHGSVGEILQSLTAAEAKLIQQGTGPSDELSFVQGALQMLRKGSPLSEVITFALIKRAAQASLATVFSSDAAMVGHFVQGHGDFFEGVTALLIDKPPRAPKWKYSTVDQVPAEVTELFFKGGPFEQTLTSHMGQLARSLTKGRGSTQTHACMTVSPIQQGAWVSLSARLQPQPVGSLRQVGPTNTAISKL